MPLLKLFYQLLYRWLLVPLVLLSAHLSSPFHAKVRAGLKLRRKKNGRRPWLDFPAQQKPFWIHCSSGEIEYAKPVARELKKRAPEIKILVTYFSPSSQKNIESCPEVDWSTPLPYDRPGDWRAFLNYHQPRALLVARTDIWPEMLWQCAAHTVPTALFSATFVASSGRNQKWVRAFYAAVMGQFTRIFCVSEGDHAELGRLGLSEIATVAGDTRYDQVLYRLQHARPIKSELFQAPRENVFLAGSTWSEDEEVLLPALKDFKRQLKFIIAPHEPSPSHLRQLEDALTAQGLSCLRYSQASAWTTEDVLLIDQVGLLADLYRHAGCAFVGGSFRKTVHSVMEPLASGCLTLVGPKHLNNREAIAFQDIAVGTTADTSHQAVAVLHTTEDCKEFLSAWQNQSAQEVKDITRQIGAAVAARSGSSQVIAEWALANPSPSN